MTASVRYRESAKRDPESPYDDDSVEGMFDPEDRTWRWQMDGRKRAIAEEPRKRARSGNWVHSHQAYDGEKAQSANFARDDPRKMLALEIVHGSDGRFPGLFPDNWLGIRLPRTEETLASLLSRSQARIIAWEPIDGHDCLHIDLGDCSAASGQKMSWKVWLDPRCDWLPRLLFSRTEGTDPEGRPRPLEHRQGVTEFRRVPDPLLARDRWFPEKVYSRLVVRHDYEVLNVALNEALPGTVFQIEPQTGTQVTERFASEPARPRRARVHGGQ